MIVEPLAIRGAAVLRAEVHSDDRGFFRRIADTTVLAESGMESAVDQVSMAMNLSRGTVRGMHYQADPDGEAKTLWCLTGSVFDVLVDVRPDEPTYGQWVSVLLSADEPTAVHVPRGVAHGYQTLADNTSLAYLISSPYVPASARSLRWSDPDVGIAWPLPVSCISDRDREASPWPPPR